MPSSPLLPPLPGVIIHQKNVWRAKLRELCEGRCEVKYVKTVEDAVSGARKVSPNKLEEAVDQVVAALCPYPAKKIRDWFWGTRAGHKVALAQWQLYGKDALSPSQAARLFWGDNKARHLKRLQELIEEGKLHIYFDPRAVSKNTDLMSGKVLHETYLRRTEVLRLLEIGGYEMKEKKKKGEKKEATPK